MNVDIKQPSQQGGDIRGVEEGVKIEGRSFGRKDICTFLARGQTNEIAPQTHDQVSDLRRNHPKRETSVATREHAAVSYLHGIKYLPTSIFSHGHLYVGFSPCRDLDKVFVYANQKEFNNIRHLLENG